MGIDLGAARSFVGTHARLLDRRRFDVVVDGGDPAGILGALEGYGNDDGGYGWGLESDLRSPESQPAGALHAFEALADAAPRTSPRAAELCDWLETVSLPDGGLPFALPITDPTGCAPWWVDSDRRTSSLQITSAVAALADQVARHDAAVARHPWLKKATSYCLNALADLDEEPHAYVLLFGVTFLEAVAGSTPEAPDLLEGLRRYVPADGLVRVEGGTADEVMRPLDFAPDPDGLARRLFSADAIRADLARLAADQKDDGGWPYEAATFSPASALEWRGHVTLRAVSVLRSNGAA